MVNDLDYEGVKGERKIFFGYVILLHFQLIYM